MSKKIISILSFLALALCVNAQNVINYGFYHGSERLVNWGTGKAETYNIAIHVNNAGLVGKKVKSVIIPIVTGTSSVADYSAFLTRELKVSSGKAVPDITSVRFEPDGEWTKVTFAEPYTIEEGGFYAGYTLVVGSVDAAGDKFPVCLMTGANPDGLYVATSRTYRKWNSLSETYGASSPLALEIEGDFRENTCRPMAVADTRAKVGDEFTVKATIANNGVNTINDIDCIYSIGDDGANTFEYNIKLDEPLTAQFYGGTKEISFNVPAGKMTANGTYKGTFKVVRVNGAANNDAAVEVTNSVRMMAVVPLKRPVMEEYTGTWCGYCPRGWVAMRLLNEKYPGRFIAVSYHGGDIMQIHDGYDDPFPVKVDGFPYSTLDRVHGTDPYLGDGNTPMGIEQLWLSRCEMETPVNIDVEATLTDANTIKAVATATFVNDMENVPYRLAYMVTADGLKGNTSFWVQDNYFVGKSGYGPEMDMFTKGEPKMLIEYDDVLIANTDYNGIENSLPGNAVEAQTAGHTYEFALNTMVSTYVNAVGESLVQDMNRLNVVALVVNPATGEIVNAAKCRVKNPSGVRGIDNTVKSVSSVKYFDLSGRALMSVPSQGVFIKSVTYDDGTREIHKIRK